MIPPVKGTPDAFGKDSPHILSHQIFGPVIEQFCPGWINISIAPLAVKTGKPISDTFKEG
jgi:hypothetical protein